MLATPTNPGLAKYKDRVCWRGVVKEGRNDKKVAIVKGAAGKGTCNHGWWLWRQTLITKEASYNWSR